MHAYLSRLPIYALFKVLRFFNVFRWLGRIPYSQWESFSIWLGYWLQYSLCCLSRWNLSWSQMFETLALRSLRLAVLTISSPRMRCGFLYDVLDFRFEDCQTTRPSHIELLGFPTFSGQVIAACYFRRRLTLIRIFIILLDRPVEFKGATKDILGPFSFRTQPGSLCVWAFVLLWCTLFTICFSDTCLFNGSVIFFL